MKFKIKTLPGNIGWIGFSFSDTYIEYRKWNKRLGFIFLSPNEVPILENGITRSIRMYILPMHINLKLNCKISKLRKLFLLLENLFWYLTKKHNLLYWNIKYAFTILHVILLRSFRCEKVYNIVSRIVTF